MLKFIIGSEVMFLSNATAASEMAVRMLKDAPDGTTLLITLPNGKKHSVTKTQFAKHWNHPGFAFSAS